eukprot:TRINITY_DN79518_c0_g1_i1.p1 TRINITY_DN79518_c0_g1~~TRINITY_DN79518_c0_g1_i1.p1  ORF type:complete len:365 (+),score=60.53 TRINITY_DN79518_c0_g1_i1:69-1163(+)
MAGVPTPQGLSQRGQQMQRVHNNRIRLDQQDHLVPLQSQYADARRTAGQVKKQLDQAIESKEAVFKQLPRGQEGEEGDLFMELKYLRLLSELYHKNVTLMNNVYAYINDRVANGQEESEFDGIYAKLIRWFHKMEGELRHVLGLPQSELVAMFATLRTRVMGFMQSCEETVAAHPLKCAAAVGMVAGGALLHNYFTGVCISAKILFKLGPLGSCACQSVGWAAAFGVGSLGGVFAVLIGTCIYNCFHETEIPVDADLNVETANHFTDVDRAVDSIKEALQNSSNQELEDELFKIIAFWDHFSDFDPQIDTEACPVCLASPPVQPVRFRGCTGRHFHCQGCRDDCLRTNAGGGVCTVCRQPAPRG